MQAHLEHQMQQRRGAGEARRGQKKEKRESRKNGRGGVTASGCRLGVGGDKFRLSHGRSHQPGFPQSTPAPRWFPKVRKIPVAYTRAFALVGGRVERAEETIGVSNKEKKRGAESEKGRSRERARPRGRKRDRKSAGQRNRKPEASIVFPKPPLKACKPFRLFSFFLFESPT